MQRLFILLKFIFLVLASANGCSQAKQIQRISIFGEVPLSYVTNKADVERVKDSLAARQVQERSLSFECEMFNELFEANYEMHILKGSIIIGEIRYCDSTSELVLINPIAATIDLFNTGQNFIAKNAFRDKWVPFVKTTR